MDELEGLVALNHAPQLNPLTARRLIERLGSVQRAAKEAHPRPSWREDLRLAEERGVALIPYWDPLYPASLKTLPDHPLLLYVQGSLGEARTHAIAIVGTRTCTLYGREMAERLSRECARSGCTVVSGLARGIDTAAHEGALQGGRTLAVIGSGLARLYPKENASLAKRISEQGAVISELPMLTAPEKWHFPRRNRLVSALSHAALLVEAPSKSGALITMDYAFRQGKPCAALPGRADSAAFCGNHALIKAGKARLVENSQEVLSLLGLRGLSSQPAQEPGIYLDAEEKALITHFPNEEISLEELGKRAGLPSSRLSALLMSLLLKQAVREYPGKRYKKRQHG
jgi:DNA processing protein